MALEIFPDPILALQTREVYTSLLQTQLTMPIFVYKYFKLNLLVSNNIVFQALATPIAGTAFKR